MTKTHLIFTEHGIPLDALSLSSAPLPSIKDGETLLKINATPINPADLNFIEGTYGLRPSLPATAGLECCATVLKSSSSEMLPGTIVLPTESIGAWSTHCIAKTNTLIALPAEIDLLQAAMLKVNPATAWLLLHHFTELNPNSTITINAANSAVGQCLIQLAKSLKIQTICFLRNIAEAPALIELGATDVFPDSAEGLASARERFGKNPAQLALNSVGGDSALRLLKLLQAGSTHVTFGAMSRKPLTIPNGPLIFSDIRVRGFWVSQWMKRASRMEKVKIYTDLAQRVCSGNLTQKIHATFRLAEYQRALNELKSETRNGKILFIP